MNNPDLHTSQTDIDTVDTALISENEPKAPLDHSNPITHTYLSTLPIHLRPLSPYLAALHDARIRLLSIQLRSPIRWCLNCGSLRDSSIPQPSPAVGVGEGSSTASGGRKKKSPKKKASPAKSLGVGMSCSSCGEKYRRATEVSAKVKADQGVLASFKPARAVRRTRKDDHALHPDITQNTIPNDIFTPPSSSTLPLTPTIPTEDDPMTGAPPPPSPSTLFPATPLAWPQLRYIPSTSPHPPTYNQPPSVNPPNTTASIAGKVTHVSGGDKGGGPEAVKRKKKKASGLARLLAQSKEREEGEGGGKWGFG